MKNISKKIILIFSMLILVLLSNNVYAAGNFSISKGSASLKPGATTTITVSASGCAGRFNISSSNTGVATVDKSSVFLDDSSETITITAKTDGTATISIVASDVTDTDLNDVTGTKSCTVTVKTPEQTTNNNTTSNNTSSSSNSSTTKPEVKKSSDSKLKALSVKGYTISPEFNSSTKEYTLNVPYEVTSIDISASVNHSKATYSVSGDEELEVGENEVIVKGRAEDGSTTKYVIKVTRARQELHLSSIIAKITDENGIITELPLNPLFSFDVFEYTLEQISHKIEKIDIEALANLEGATVEITGNENLQEGENTITITARIPKENVAEGDKDTEEVKVYTIKVNKEATPVVIPPTMMGTIKDFFDNNNDKIISGTLLACSIAFIGLTIYLIVDYKKYKTLIKKVAELSKLNNEEVIESKNVAEEIVEEVKEEKKVGRHF